MSEPEPSGLRIGDAERNAAMAALDAHLQAGRLDAIEYGERSARASTARTVDELRPLFDDLPPPHPPQLSGAVEPAPATQVTPATRAPAAAARTDRPGALERWGPRVSGVLPLIALVLFLVVPVAHPWVFFLLIPIGGALFAGSRRDRHDDGR